MSYRIAKLTRSEYLTLCWLADHGYDAGILAASSLEAEDDDTGDVTLGPIPEHVAWVIRDEATETDPHAFLANNAHPGLADKLWDFIDSIV